MKYLIILIISFISLNSFACKNSVPESESARYINANGVGVAGLYECKDKPLEKCHCFDNLGAWETLELVDEYVVDYISKVDEVACESELDCDEKFAALDCAEKIKNYESLSVYCAVPVMKIDGKKLVENKAKKAAHEAAKVEEEAQELTKRDRKKAVRKALKEADLDGANSIVKLKVIVKALLEAQE